MLDSQHPVFLLLDNVSHLLSAVAAKFSKAATASIFLISKTFVELFFFFANVHFLPECPYQGFPFLVRGGDSVKHLMFLLMVMVVIGCITIPVHVM